MKILQRRKEAIAQLEEQLKEGTKPTKLSAETAKAKGLKMKDGKYREPLSGWDIYKKQDQIKTLKDRIA